MFGGIHPWSPDVFISPDDDDDEEGSGPPPQSVTVHLAINK